MSIEQFLLYFRRFVARHGKPREIIYDNSSQFKLASGVITKLWRNILSKNYVFSYATDENIKWKYIVELTP